MLVYLRKLTPNDTKRQIETTSEAYTSFFGGDIDNSLGVNVIIRNSHGLSPVNYTVSKAAGNANSYRFRATDSNDPSLGAYINQNTSGGFKENDILKIEKRRNEFKLFIINESDQEYNVLQSLLMTRENTVVITEEVDMSIIDTRKPFESNFSRNRIIFGAPGTGKSFQFNIDKNELLGTNQNDFERVTFHPDYSYAQFVGTYKPVTSNLFENDFIPILKDIHSIDDLTIEKFEELSEITKTDTNTDGIRILVVLLGLKFSSKEAKSKIVELARESSGSEHQNSQINYAVKAAKFLKVETASEISYEYVPGPFMRILVKALRNKRSDNIKPYLLLIEEINRANVAAVFGDVFQLLDRDESNQSEYPIQTSEDMKKYLVKELGGVISDYDQIRIPDNMFIWATMNSADQGVFPMDTAFKRRWDFTYQGINEGENDIESFNQKMGGSKISVNWNDLRKAINKELIDHNINEDKLLGAHFVKKESLQKKETFDKTFKSKVIMYLFDDAAKQRRSSLFSGVISPRSYKLYSDICEAYDEVGIDIFSEDIRAKVINLTSEENNEEAN